MLRLLSLMAGLAMVAAALIAGLALRDTPGREAVGEPRLATRGGQAIEYYASGPANGRPVVLLASFGRGAADFNELASDLVEAGYRTLSVQPRGVDHSTLPWAAPTLMDYAADVAAVLDAEGIAAPLALIGHAYGNRIARAFSTRHPRHVAALVLISAGESAPPTAIAGDIWRSLLPLGGSGPRQQAISRAFFAPGNPVPAHWLTGWYPRTALAQAVATARTPAEQWVDGGQAPMLVIQAEQDAAAPGAGVHLKQRLPGRVQLVALADAGHAALPEQGEALARHIRAFLALRYPPNDY